MLSQPSTVIISLAIIPCTTVITSNNIDMIIFLSSYYLIPLYNLIIITLSYISSSYHHHFVLYIIFLSSSLCRIYHLLIIITYSSILSSYHHHLFFYTIFFIIFRTASNTSHFLIVFFSATSPLSNIIIINTGLYYSLVRTQLAPR